MSEDDGPSHNTRLSRPALRGHNMDMTDGEATRSPKAGRKIYPVIGKKSPKNVKKIYPKLADNDSADNETDPENDYSYDNDSSNQSASTTPSPDISDGHDGTGRNRGAGKNRGVNKQRGGSTTPKVVRIRKARITFTKKSVSASEDRSSEGLGLRPILLAIAFILIASGCYMLINSSEDAPITPPGSPVDYFRLLKPNYEKLKSKFPSQSPRFWKIVGAPLKRILSEPSPLYPAVIMLGINDQLTLGTCLARSIAKEINSVYDIQVDYYINAEDMDQTSVGKAKLELDEKLKTMLSVGRVVVLDHLEKLEPDVALLLHAYCDGDNAPFKNTTVILVVHANEESVDMTERGVEKFLTQLWQPELGVDETPALLSRVANNIAVVTREPGQLDHC